ncbi:MAG: J domain-containing protein [Fibrella sp.]|nr:J domain-containing protein [Armatimonadota bacterium]
MATGPNYKDYYKLLGVEKNASEKEIKSAYRKLARKYHPDVNPGDAASENKFKEMQEAYDVLGEPDKRKKYDQFGDQWKAYSQAGTGFPGGAGNGAYPGGFRVEYGGGVDPSQFGDMNDLFASLFGDQMGGARRGGASPFGAGMRQAPQRGADTEANLTITVEEAYSGVTKSLNISGESRYDLNRGANGDNVGKRVEVKIPAGVAEGQKIRVSGQGIPGAAGNGDLYLIVRIAPSDTFERKGDDLYADVPVPFYDAALGGEVKVPTPKGTRLTMRVPAGVQSGQSLRLAGQGMPKLKSGGGFGDLYARIKVTVPKSLSERQTELLAELKTLSEGNPA